MRNHLIFMSPLLVLFMAWLLPSHAVAVPIVDVGRGTLVAEGAEGDVLPMPLVSTDVEITVTGPIARTTVTQSFQNDSDQWVEALYLFPLPEDAAVDRMQLVIGDRVIEGEIQEKEEAKQTYETAKKDGYKAALVEQDRPNLFHTSVANIPPAGEITVRIEYQQSLVWRDEAFSLRFPLAITPRFSPATQAVEETIDLSTGWQMLPEERPQALDIEGLVKPETTIAVSLAPGFEIGMLDSSSHPIAVTEQDDARVRLTVGDGSDTLKPRDFVLRWAPVTMEMPQAAFFSEEHQTGHYGLVTLTPPDLELPFRIAREILFIIDTSGSMQGESMTAAKQALRVGIEGLEPGDAFNIIEFNTSARALFPNAREIDEDSRAAGLDFLRGLQADGGTNMRGALTLALQDKDYPSDRLRQIFFMTDGAVGNERDLFDFIHSHLGRARLFTLGIGSAPNSHFMREAALAGKGTYTYVDGRTDIAKAITALFDKVSQPVLTNIEVSGSGISDISPQVIPDLYKGEPLAFAARLDEPTGEVLVTGRLGDVAWRQTVKLTAANTSRGIATDWAKRMIDEWQRSYLIGVPHEEAKTQITQLGLDYHLVTAYTSLVGVDKTPSRPQTASLEEQAIPSQMPDGLKLQSGKYKTQQAQTTKTLAFAATADGYQVSILLGLLLIVLAGLGYGFQRRREAVQA